MRLGTGLTLLVGGARSGKSDLAVQLGQAWPGTVVFVATATAGDEDMASRIERHQQERPATWNLVEAPMVTSADAVQFPHDALVIVDCLTMLVSNLFFADCDEAAIDAHVVSLAAALAARSAPSIVISNEVGLGIHPATEMGRTWRDLQGRMNRRLATTAQTALLVVAGRVVELDELEITW